MARQQAVRWLPDAIAPEEQTIPPKRPPPAEKLKLIAASANETDVKPEPETPRHWEGRQTMTAVSGRHILPHRSIWADLWAILGLIALLAVLASVFLR